MDEDEYEPDFDWGAEESTEPPLYWVPTKFEMTLRNFVVAGALVALKNCLVMGRFTYGNY